MSVVIASEEAGPWRRKLTIEVPSPAVEAEAGRVMQELRGTVQVPGFRKGKVPTGILKKRFADEIRQGIVDRLVPRYWKQAEGEKSFDLMSSPHFEDLTMEEGQPMTFTVLIEVRPEIQLGDLENFDLPQGDPEPDDDAVEAALRDLARNFAERNAVDRPAAVGDVVVGTAFDVSEEPEESAEIPSSPFEVEVGGDGVDEELTLALTGLKADQSTLLERTHGEGEEARQLKHRLEVSRVFEQEIPAPDDELAKKISDLETADALREEVRSRMRAGKERELRRTREQALLEQLRERHPLELPVGAVEEETQQVMREYANHLASQGVDIEKAEINWESLVGQMQPMAERRVHERLILDAVAASKELRVDEKELETILAQIASSQKKSSLAIRHEMSQSGRLQQLKTDLLRGRAIRHLLGEDAAADSDAETTDSDDSSSDNS